jgi:spore maturation protein CgeB
VRIAYFTHSLRSCWNHGNAHFLRGVLSELVHRGHEGAAYEPETGWSLDNLLADHGREGLRAFEASYPELRAATYASVGEAVEQAAAADLVIVHEWNEPELVAALGRARARGGWATTLFHDTHHRAVSDPQAIRAFDLGGYDGVLAFGEALTQVYRRWGWGGRVWAWHEAADTRRFFPVPPRNVDEHLIWIGNWGDEERSEEIETYLLRPARDAGLPLTIHGVRYPPHALAKLAEYGAHYAGWLPNAGAPAAFARALATVHVPRRYYSTILPGIPTIRVFEALACGVPLVSAPWEDSEGLFRPGDFLWARSGDDMTRQLKRLAADPAERADLSARGLETIRARHTCAHRADELLAVVDQLTTKREAA